jgi:serine protease Do
VNNLKEISGAKIENTSIPDAQGRPMNIESPAQKAGLEAGDVILMADGKKIDRVSTLQRILRSHQPGDVVTLEGVRYGEKKTFKVKLTEAPQDEARTVASNTRREEAPGSTTTSLSKLGIGVEVMSARVAEARGISDRLKGVVVTDVAAGSTAEARLFPGDVIVEVRHPSKSIVSTVADLQKEIGKLKSGEYVSLLVGNTQRDGTPVMRVVNLRIGE